MPSMRMDTKNKPIEEKILEERIKDWKKNRLDYICKIAIPFFISGIITSCLVFYFVNHLYGVEDINLSVSVWFGTVLFIPYLVMTYPKRPTIIDVHLDLSLMNIVDKRK